MKIFIVFNLFILFSYYVDCWIIIVIFIYIKFWVLNINVCIKCNLYGVYFFYIVMWLLSEKLYRWNNKINVFFFLIDLYCLIKMVINIYRIFDIKNIYLINIVLKFGLFVMNNDIRLRLI